MALSLGSLRIAHWQVTPGAASLRASAPRAATARVSLSVTAEISSRDRRIRRHQSLRKKVRAPAAWRHASGGACTRGALPTKSVDTLTLRDAGRR